MNLRNLIILCLVPLFAAQVLFAQSSRVSMYLIDRDTKAPVDLAYVVLSSSHRAVTDSIGVCLFDNVPFGKYLVKISHLNYKPISRIIIIDKENQHFSFALIPAENVLKDIYVVARESKGMTSSSNIGRDAIDRIQPSCFADLLELIPGGYASDPALGSPNIIALREVNRPSSNYNTSSLGTSFLLDGRRLNTDANMQWMLGATNPSSTTYMDHFLNCGVDMRSISTDDIDSVTIVRGIPSVRYGELTSGLIKIERKQGRRILDARFKADRKSKLYYIGKGFENRKKKVTLNLSLDYLNYNPEPRTTMFSYQRATGSVRGSKTWMKDYKSLRMNLALDFVGNLDIDKEDAEMNDGQINKSSSSYSSTSLSTKINYINRAKNAIFTEAELTASTSYERDIMSRERFISSSRITLLQTNRTEGEFDAIILPQSYVGWQKVDGKPFYSNVQMLGTIRLPFGRLKSKLTAGVEWDMSKNFGLGQIIEEGKPPFDCGDYRARAYVDIPASHHIGMFVENQTTIPVGNHKFRSRLGLRTISIVSLGNKFSMNGHFWYDPRVNLQWEFPKVDIFGFPFLASITGGYGLQTKMPTLNQLYPELNYEDITEFSMTYPPKMQRVHYRTYINDPTNYSLKPARNKKWEIRADLEYAGISATITYYDEDMTSGFRSQGLFNIYDYVKYSIPKGMNWGIYSDIGPIPLSELNATPIKEIRAYGIYTNGSRTYKKGLEYTLMTPRYKSIATRFTVSGAWFYTKYENSLPYYAMSSAATGSGMLFQLVGKYKQDNSYIRWMTNTNFNADTYIPFIGLEFSLSCQCLWKEVSYMAPFSACPMTYIGIDGVEKPYNEEEISKIPELKLLMRDTPSGWYNRREEPFAMNINLKATKKLFNEKLRLSIFVNKLFDAHPDYRIDNVLIRRYVNAYFGMEMNIRL